MKSTRVNYVIKEYGRYQITSLCTKYLCLAFITLIAVPKSSLSKHVIICDFDLFSKIWSHIYTISPQVYCIRQTTHAHDITINVYNKKAKMVLYFHATL